MLYYVEIYIYIYTEPNYKRNTIFFAPIFHKLNSKIEDFFYVHKRPISLKYLYRDINLAYRDAD